MKRCLVDLNVWLALAYSDHEHYSRSVTWFGSTDTDLLFCRQTQIGFLRLISTKSVMGAHVKTQQEAWLAYDALAGAPRVSFADEPPGMELDFRAYSSLPLAAPKLWADAYLAAFANAAGLAFATFDAGFGNRNQVRDLLVIS